MAQGMTTRQAEILLGLATDARDLKVKNGWYGDRAQGNSTLDEDNEAIHVMRDVVDRIRNQELHDMQERVEKAVRSMVYMIPRIPHRHRDIGGKYAYDFFGFNLDGDVDRMEEIVTKLGRLIDEDGEAREGRNE